MAGHRYGQGKRARSSDPSEKGGHKRRNPDEDSHAIGPDDTVYRYLCPAQKIGSIIGRGGDIVKQLRLDTNSKITIRETVPGCDERVVIIYSTSQESNPFDELDTQVCPAQDALFRVHDRVIAEESAADDDPEGIQKVIARFLVPNDQIGCILGKGGQIVQTIRTETGAQIRILKDEHLPRCALSTDELLQISGEAPVVRKALYQIASRLHDNPSRTQHLLAKAVHSSLYSSPDSLMGGPGGTPIHAPVATPYGGYNRSHSFRAYTSLKEFSVRVVCRLANIGGVIGKDGAIIKKIRQETRASIKVDTSAAKSDDCLITISSKEYFMDQVSPTIEAARLLQPRCSEKEDFGIVSSYTTRILVHCSCVGCLVGKGGAIINEMRNTTRATIRILSKDDLPMFAADDDEIVLISGCLNAAENALVNITSRLRANLFEKEGQVILPFQTCASVSPEVDRLPYEGGESRRYGRDGTYSAGYSSNDLPPPEPYGSYDGLQSSGGGTGYGAYGGYSGRTSSSGFSGRLSGPSPGSRRKPYY